MDSVLYLCVLAVFCLDGNSIATAEQCSDSPPSCGKDQFCVNDNDKNTFICSDCNPACNGCVGSSNDNCKSCADGYFPQGRFCLECPLRTFGRNCSETCHCLEPESCHKSTGACSLLGCSAGWRDPPGCREPCAFGTFGLACDQTCHCLDNNYCSKVTGWCLNNTQCSPGYGSASCQWHLPKLVKPPNVSVSCTVANVTWNAFKLDYDIGRGPIIAYTLYKLQKNGSWLSVTTKMEKRSTYWHFLSNLKRDGDYKFRVDVHGNDDGKLLDAVPGFATDWIRILCSDTTFTPPTTTERHIKDVFQSVEAILLSSGDIRATWTFTPDTSDINFKITVYYQIVSTGDCNNTRSQDVVSVPVSPGLNSIVINSLEPWRVYDVTVKAVAINRNITNSTTRRVHSKEIAPRGAVTDVKVEDITSTKVVLSWSPPSCEDRGGVLLQYDVVVARQTGTSRTVPANQTSVTINQLVPFSFYSVKVRYVNRVGQGPFSTETNFTTNQSVPSPPRILSVHEMGNDINITFTRPDRINGVLIEYSVSYSKQSDFRIATSVTIPALNTTSARSVRIGNLEPLTLYYMKIRARTQAGYGSFSPVFNFTTMQGFPSAPRSLSVYAVNETCVTIGWEPPLQSNGIIQSYQILYRESSLPETSTIEDEVSKSESRYTKCRLSPGRRYTFSVAAKNAKGYGSLNTRNIWTEHATPESPQPPVYVNSTYTTITITIQPVVLMSGPLTAYIIKVENVSARRKRVISVPGYATAWLSQSDVLRPTVFVIGDGNVYGGITNIPLNQKTKYNIYYVVNSTLNGLTKLSYAKMPAPILTVPGPIITTPTIQTTASTTFLPPVSDNTGLIIGVVIGILLLILIILLLILLFCWYRQRSRKSHYFPSTFNDTLDTAPVMDDYDLEKYWNKIYSVGEKRYIVAGLEYLPNTKELPRVQIDGVPVSFADEFKNILHKTKRSCQEAKHRRNKQLNRFPHLLPYDTNRVILEPDEDSSSDYINASEITGYDQYRYIAATSPFNNSTALNFWRMIFQYDIKTIVMITKSIEDNIIKCTEYWPFIGTVTLGSFILELIETDVFADYIIRTVSVSRINSKKVLTTTIFEYTSWPDHGVPDDSIPLLEMRYKVRQHHNDNTRPVVVHCGTGVGRTGTYIAIDCLIDQYAEERRVSVFEFVRKLRKERSFMVRTQRQYVFIYEALFEKFHAGDTLVGFDLREMYQELIIRNEKTGHSFLKDQFKLLETYTRQLHPSQCQTALAASNFDKNRYRDVIPLERYRPKLTTPGGVGRTDYINATFVDSYRMKNAFIITQTPLHTTVIDFWKMIYDYNVTTIVMVENFTNEDDTCAKYWPDVNMKPFEPFFIETSATYQEDNVTIRNFKLFNSCKPKEPARHIRQFQFNSWAETSFVPVSKTMILDLMDLVNGWDLVSNKNQSPVVVHCKDGATHSGLYCALSVICEKMDVDGEVDVYHTIKHIKRRRHQVVAQAKQYRFCFKTLWDFMNLRMQERNVTGSFEGSKHGTLDSYFGISSQYFPYD